MPMWVAEPGLEARPDPLSYLPATKTEALPYSWDVRLYDIVDQPERNPSSGTLANILRCPTAVLSSESTARRRRVGRRSDSCGRPWIATTIQRGTPESDALNDIGGSLKILLLKVVGKGNGENRKGEKSFYPAEQFSLRPREQEVEPATWKVYLPPSLV